MKLFWMIVLADYKNHFDARYILDRLYFIWQKENFEHKQFNEMLLAWDTAIFMLYNHRAVCQ